jgi:hypothetical protein
LPTISPLKGGASIGGSNEFLAEMAVPSWVDDVGMRAGVLRS